MAGNMYAAPGFVKLREICQRLYESAGSKDAVNFVLSQALYSLGYRWSDGAPARFAVSSAIAAARLDRAFRQTEERLVHLCPLDLGDDVPELRFGPNAIRNFTAEELDDLIDPNGLLRKRHDWRFESRRLIIDTTGADHLHGGEEAILEGLVSRLAASGIEARAPWRTPGARRMPARFLARPISIAPVGQAPAIVRRLQIGALRLADDIVTGLLTLGFERVGDLEAAPRAALTLRFGPELDRRLDQALGRCGEPFEPARSPEIIEVRRAFGEPISVLT